MCTQSLKTFSEKTSEIAVPYWQVARLFTEQCITSSGIQLKKGRTLVKSKIVTSAQYVLCVRCKHWFIIGYNYFLFTKKAIATPRPLCQVGIAQGRIWKVLLPSPTCLLPRVYSPLQAQHLNSPDYYGCQPLLFPGYDLPFPVYGHEVGVGLTALNIENL